MEVGDEDLGAAEVLQHVRRHKFAAGVVALRIVRQQHAQTVADGDAGRHHQEAPREARAVRAVYGVHRLPSDEHGHHGGLAGAGGELQRQAVEAWVRLVVGVLQVIEEAPRLTAELRRHFHQPDGGFGGFHLAEERPDASERMVPPVAQQPRRLRRHLPLALRQFPPRGNLLAHAVDDVRVLILLVRAVHFRSGLVERKLALATPALGLGDGRDEGRLPPALDDAVGGTPRVEFPMPLWGPVGRVEDRLLEEAGQSVGRCLDGRDCSGAGSLPETVLVRRVGPCVFPSSPPASVMSERLATGPRTLFNLLDLPLPSPRTALHTVNSSIRWQHKRVDRRVQHVGDAPESLHRSC